MQLDAQEANHVDEVSQSQMQTGNPDISSKREGSLGGTPFAKDHQDQEDGHTPGCQLLIVHGLSPDDAEQSMLRDAAAYNRPLTIETVVRKRIKSGFAVCLPGALQGSLQQLQTCSL